MSRSTSLADDGFFFVDKKDGHLYPYIRVDYHSLSKISIETYKNVWKVTLFKSLICKVHTVIHIRGGLSGAQLLMSSVAIKST